LKFINHIIFFNEEIENLAFKGGKTSKEQKLFESFKTHPNFKDKQRMGFVNEEGDYANIDVNFRKLKSRLGKKLLTAYIISELDNLNFTIDKFKNTFYLYYSICKQLWYKNQIDLAIPILDKLFRQAFKYKLSLPCRDIAFDLFNIYTSYKPDKKKSKFYNDAFLIWKAQCDIYYEVEMFRLLLVPHFFGEIKEIDKSLLDEYAKSCEQLIIKMDQILDIEVYELACDILCFVYGHQRKYDNIIVTINKLLQFKNKFKIYKKSTEWSIYYNLLLANVNLGEYENAEKNLIELYTFLTVGGRYWQIIKGIEFSLYIKIAKYREAYGVAKEVYLSINKSNNNIVSTIWQMKLAYIVFIQKILNLEENLDNNPIPEFELKKFIRSTKLLAKDKSGYNLNIKIIKILNYLINAEYDKAFDEIEYFNIYKNKYIKKDENPRSRYFITLLQILASTGFHPVRTKAHAKKIHDKLIKTELITTSEYVNNEIIPYEFLWELILNLLIEKRKIGK
jgi:hypothetical protein